MAEKKKLHSDSDYVIETENNSEDKKLRKHFKVKKRESLTGVLNFSGENSPEENQLAKNDESAKTKSQVNIVVEEEDRSYQISSNNLEEILTNNKKVKRIVIEDISTDKAQRMQIHVDNREKFKNKFQKTLSDVDGKKESVDRVGHSQSGMRLLPGETERDVLPHQTHLKRIDQDEDHLPSDDSQVLVDKVELVRKKGRPKNISSYYYRAKEHLDLYQVGMSFLRDIRDNKKCFSFEHLNNKLGQQNTILGVSLFLMFHVNRKSLVITHNFDESIYSKIMGNKVNKKICYRPDDLTYPVVECDGIRFIEYIDLFKIMTELKKTSFEDFVDHLIATNDTLLVDFPEVSKLEKKKEIFFPLINTVDSVSLVIDLKNCKKSELAKLHSYFKRYDVPVKGVTISGKKK